MGHARLRSPALVSRSLVLLLVIASSSSVSAAGLTSLLRRETSMLASLETLVARVTRAVAERERLLRRQRLLKYELAEATRRIKALERRTRARSGDLRQRLLGLYKLSRGRSLRLLVEAKSRRDLLLRRAALRHVLRRDLGELALYRESLAKLNSERARLEEARRAQKTVAATLTVKTRELDLARREQVRLFRRVRRSRRFRQKASGELSSAQEALLRRVARLEQRLSYAGGFVGRRGRLARPVGGAIVGSFGHVIDKATKLPVLRSGVTFRPARRSRARAIYPGIVRLAREVDGYGKLVLIDHGAGYYTVYGFLHELRVKVGQRVRLGTVLGRCGRDPLDGRSALYFEIRDHTQPIDPRPWFRR